MMNRVIFDEPGYLLQSARMSRKKRPQLDKEVQLTPFV